MSRKGFDMNINVHQIKVKVYCLKDIERDSYNAVSSLIDKSFFASDEMCKYHKKGGYKFYNHGNLGPYSEDGFKEGKIYSFYIRTVDNNLVKHFMDNLLELQTDELLVMYTSKSIIRKQKFKHIEAITPIQIKTELGYWRNGFDEEFFYDRIINNIIKKYNQFNNKNIIEGYFNPFKEIIMRRSYTQRYYKGRLMLGDKCRFVIDDNKLSQDLAYFALGVGVGEMNARGFGFLAFHSEDKEEVKK